jgi:hypothetical protein
VARKNIVTTWDDNSKDVTMPTALETALQTQFTAANTDIRPEDALYATNKYHGSGTGCTGMIYKSASSGSTATATTMKFSLIGNDPCTGTYTRGGLPTCNTNDAVKCTVTPNRSFATLRSGQYKAWSVYRVVTYSNYLANTQKLVSQAQKVAATIVPDFVPFSPVCGATANTSLIACQRSNR